MHKHTGLAATSRLAERVRERRMSESAHGHGSGSGLAEADPAADLLDVLVEQRVLLLEMRDDLARLGREIEALRREATVHDDATRRQLGQVASANDRKR